MILFTILAIILAIVAFVILAIMGVIGSAALAIFGDLIVCVLIIALLVKIFRKKK